MSQKAKRLRGVTVDKAFVYGTVSRFLKKTDDQHHFAWTVYLRGLVRRATLFFDRVRLRVAAACRILTREYLNSLLPIRGSLRVTAACRILTREYLN